MSDLAPIVAAALRDKVVVDLLERVKHLEKFLKEIEIVGWDSDASVSVVCAKGNLDAGVRHDDLWTVSLEQVNEVSLNQIGTLTIRLGGHEVGRTQWSTPFIKETREGFQDASNKKGEFHFTTKTTDKFLRLFFGVGPFTSFAQYEAIGGRRGVYYSDLAQFGNDHQGMRATFERIQFVYNEVQDILDNLGVSPRQN